jgi:hypothetical protein
MFVDFSLTRMEAGFMKTALLTFLMIASLGWSQSQPDGKSAFQKMITLAGDWEGKYQWTGARAGDSGTLEASYYLTGNSSALVENLIMEGVPTMTSVYHLDNSDLRVTHFCAAKNQPRLKASKIDIDKGKFDFALVDVTNVPSLDAPFVHGLDIEFLNPELVALTFHFEAAGNKSDEHITLKRVHSTEKPQGKGNRSIRHKPS